ncbi:MAG: Stealth CR1 domain-containing protein [Rickettsiales bacterium]|jgi:hypothetical protein|nr:Stealth CR1 domain-containing protein [Rickettsiales bacterium]
MKIDLVYLWVDGNDPAWRAKKDAAIKKAGGKVSKIAVAAERYEDNDELKYSLRGAEKFAPWINNIFIVTDGQVPKWLNLTHPKIHVIDHSDIMPPEFLPCFNSAFIEMFLHKIPGLSEHFIYANDDMLFGKSVSPGFFFDKNKNPTVIGKAKKWADSIHKKGGGAIDVRFRKNTMFPRILANALACVYKFTGKKYKLTLSHAIEPMRKSHLKDIIDSNKDYFTGSCGTTFREEKNIQRCCFPMINHARGRATIVYGSSFLGRRIKYSPFWPPLLIRFLMWLGGVVGLCRVNSCDPSKGGAERVIRKTLRHKPELFCLNYIAKDKRKIAADFLHKMFPEKSGFEK